MDIFSRLPSGLTLVRFQLVGGWTRRGFHHGWQRRLEDLDGIKYATDVLEVLAKQAVRCAPRAKLAVVDNKSFLAEDRIIFDAVLNDVDR